MLPIVKQFDPLTRDQILAIRPGMWGDSELLDVLKYFETEKQDRDRAMAVAELILRSPQVSDVDYGWLYVALPTYRRPPCIASNKANPLCVGSFATACAMAFA